MIRLFKHYIPHAVLLLGLLDFALLLIAADLAWTLRTSQIGIAAGSLSARVPLLIGFGVTTQTAMIAVGVYGTEALRSLRFAGARLLVAVSLSILALALIDFLLPGATFWRSILLYAMVLAIALLVLNRLVTGGILGTSAFRRRVLVLGAGHRAQRLKDLAQKPDSGFAVVGYISMSDSSPLVAEAIHALGDCRSVRATSPISARPKWCWRWKSGAMRCRSRTLCE